jgi:hypothetical protein
MTLDEYTIAQLQLDFKDPLLHRLPSFQNDIIIGTIGATRDEFAKRGIMVGLAVVAKGLMPRVMEYYPDYFAGYGVVIEVEDTRNNYLASRRPIYYKRFR